MQRPFASLVLAALLWAGCDTQAPQAPLRVVVDVRPLLYAASGAQALCVTVADEIVLTVTDGSRSRVYSQALTLEETAITFDVEAEPGTVDFDVAVWSNNRTLLYDGTRSEEVADGFMVTVPLTKRTPVLQVCPAEVVLVRTPNGAFGSFTVHNRGIGRLDWRALQPPARCNLDPCLNFDSDRGLVAAGQSEQSFVGALPGYTGGPVTVTSPEGDVVLNVQVQ